MSKAELKSAAADIAAGLEKLRRVIAAPGPDVVPRARPKSERIIRCLERAGADGLHWSTIATMVGANNNSIRPLLTSMVRRDDIERTGVRGMYRIKNHKI